MKFVLGAGLDEDYKTDREENKSDSESSQSDYEDNKLFNNNALPVETEFIEDRVEELGQVWDSDVENWHQDPDVLTVFFGSRASLNFSRQF